MRTVLFRTCGVKQETSEVTDSVDRVQECQVCSASEGHCVVLLVVVWAHGSGWFWRLRGRNCWCWTRLWALPTVSLLAEPHHWWGSSSLVETLRTLDWLFASCVCFGFRPQHENTHLQADVEPVFDWKRILIHCLGILDWRTAALGSRRLFYLDEGADPRRALQ